MHYLFRNRWLHRVLFVGVLSALGVGIYQVQPPTPICVIDAAETTARCFADSGRRVVTLPTKDFAALPSGVPTVGPLQIWDCRAGAEIGRHLEKEPMLFSPTFSKNGRMFAAETASREPGENAPLTHALHLIDLGDGSALETPPDDDRIGELRYTPAGDVLTRLIDCKEGKELQIYDSATGRLLAKHVSKHLELEELTDEAVLFRMRTPPLGWELEIWGVPERRRLVTLPDAGAPISSRDGKFVLFERLNADGEPTGAWAVWSMQSQQIEAEFQAGHQIDVQPVVSANNSRLAMVARLGERKDDPGNFVELRAFPSGRLISKLPKDVQGMRFSPDGRWLALDERQPGIPLLIADANALEAQWSLGARGQGVAEFSADSKIIFMVSARVADLVACDAGSGQARARIPLASNKNPKVHMTPDRRSLLVRQEPGNRKENWFDRIPWTNRFLPTETDSVLVIDTNACRERFRLTGWNTQHALLSDDGATLVTTHIEEASDGERRTILRCWDVNAWKPMYWPIGVPAGLAGLGVLLVIWRGRRRSAP